MDQAVQSFWNNRVSGITMGMLLDFPRAELRVNAREVDSQQSFWFFVAKHSRMQRDEAVIKGFPL